MVGEGLKLLLLTIAGWLRTRLAEFAIVTVAVIFFAVALILGSVAGHQALVPQVGPALATAIVAGAYLVLGSVAVVALYAVRRRRRRIGKSANWSAAVPKPTPGLMLAALAAGAMFGAPRRR